MEKSESIDVGSEFHLPFEFNNTDGLGPWDILLSERAIKDIRNILLSEDIKDMQLETPLTIEKIMKKLKQISSGAWDKYGLKRKVSSHIIPVYEVEVELPDKHLKILWHVDCEFSIRNYSFTQLVKVWAVTANQEQIYTTLEILENVHLV